MRTLIWTLFPLSGILLGLHFLPEETPWDNQAPRATPEIRSLALASSSIRMVEVLDAQGGRAGWMAAREFPATMARSLLRSEVHALPNGSACLSFSQAEAICRAISNDRRVCRLPTAKEWEHAARGGIPNAPTPWGWGPPPDDLLFNMDEPPKRQGTIHPHGFRDLAGGLWEWCAGGEVKGSAWSERNPETLRTDESRTMPADYTGMDVGLRIFVEP